MWEQIDLKKLEEGLTGAIVKDVHLETAVRMFGCKPSEISLEMRRQAKVVNFMEIYGWGIREHRRTDS